MSMGKIQKRMRKMWNKVNKSNKCVIGVLEEANREQGTESEFEEALAENFLKQMKDIKPYFHHAQQNQGRINTKKTTAIHIMVKLMKTNGKEKISKASSGKRHSGT